MEVRLCLFAFWNIPLLAVLCGAKGWEDIQHSGQAKGPWLKERWGRSLENGVPSHDTFGRCLRARVDQPR